MTWQAVKEWLRCLTRPSNRSAGDRQPVAAGLPICFPPPPKMLETTVRNCPPPFRFKCTLRWEDLGTTDDPGVRHCEQCSRDVFFCQTDEETIAHAREGHCIARHEPGSLALPEMVMGEAEIEMTDEQRLALVWRWREAGITDAIKNIDAIRTCPKCGYSVPHWRIDCRVCGHAVGRVPGP
jgi:hypothetical protein